MRLCVCVCVGAVSENVDPADLSALAGESGRMPARLRAVGISFILFIVFPLRLVPCNVNHVRS